MFFQFFKNGVLVGFYFTPRDLFHTSFNFGSQQILTGFGVLHSILANFNSAVVWLVSVLPQISNSFSFFSKSFGTVPCTSTTNGITVTLLLQSSFSFLERSKLPWSSLLLLSYVSVVGMCVCACVCVCVCMCSRIFLLFCYPWKQSNVFVYTRFIFFLFLSSFSYFVFF